MYYVCVCVCVYIICILFRSVSSIIRLLEDTEYSSMCWTARPCCLPVLYTELCINSSQTPSFSPFPVGLVGKNLCGQCRRGKRCRFDPCFMKIFWRTTQTPTPVFLPGGYQGLRILADDKPSSLKESNTVEPTLHGHTFPFGSCQFVYYDCEYISAL